MFRRGMQSRKTLRGLITFVVVTVFVLSNCAWAQAFRHLSEGDMVPGFKLNTVGGAEVDYANPPEVAVVLTFVRMGQDKSEAVMRELMKLDPKVMEKTTILALLVNPKDGNPQEWVKSLGVNFPVLLDHDEEVYSKYGVMVAPQTAIISPEGKLSGEIGGHTADFKASMDAKLREMLGMPAIEDKSVAVAKDLSPERKKAIRDLQKALVMMKRKMKSKALPLIKEAVAADDTYTEAHLALAEALLDEGGAENNAEAEKHLKRAEELDPKNHSIKIGQARLMSAAGDYQGAVTSLEEVAKITPKSARIYYFLGRMHQEAGQLEKAVEAYRHATEKYMEDDN